MSTTLACSGESNSRPESQAREESRQTPAKGEGASKLDTTLKMHAVETSKRSVDALRYAKQLAQLHEQADRSPSEDKKLDLLRKGIAIPLPEGSGAQEVEALRFDLAARFAELTLEVKVGDSGPKLHVGFELKKARAQDVLQHLGPMLATDRSLPMDLAVARCLVLLGDAAAILGDDPLAASSYARSIKMMAALGEEIESQTESEAHR